MTNTELLNFHFVDRTDERKLANDYISGSNNFILLVYGKSHAGKNFFIDKLEDENEKIFFLIFDFEQTKRKNALKYIKKSRKLNDKQLVYIEAKFKEHGYDKMSDVTRSRLDKTIIGNDYLKWFVDKCNELQL